MTGSAAPANLAKAKQSIGRSTSDHALRVRAQELRLAAIADHFSSAQSEAEKLTSRIAGKVTFQTVDSDAVSTACLVVTDAAGIIEQGFVDYGKDDWKAPLGSEQAQALLMYTKSMKAASSMLITAAWSALQPFATPADIDELIRPLQANAMSLAVDGHWLSTVVSHLIDGAEASRMQKHRARRRARLHQATVYYHENEVKTLEKIGLLPTGEAHDAADVQNALSTFISMAFELAESASIHKGKSGGADGVARAWGGLMTDFVAAGREGR